MGNFLTNLQYHKVGETPRCSHHVLSSNMVASLHLLSIWAFIECIDNVLTLTLELIIHLSKVVVPFPRGKCTRWEDWTWQHFRATAEDLCTRRLLSHNSAVCWGTVVVIAVTEPLGSCLLHFTKCQAIFLRGMWFPHQTL